MRHWLFGAVLSIVLLTILFSLLLVYYSLNAMNCHAIEPSTSSISVRTEHVDMVASSRADVQNGTRVVRSATNRQQRQRQSPLTNEKPVVKGVWTIYGYQTYVCTGGSGRQRMKDPQKEDVWSACPEPYKSNYCFNGGECVLWRSQSDEDADDSFVKLCKCASNYHGRRCEYVFDSNVFGFNTDRSEVETAALSTLATLLVACALAFFCCYFLYRKYGRLLYDKRQLHSNLTSCCTATATTTSTMINTNTAGIRSSTTTAVIAFY